MTDTKTKALWLDEIRKKNSQYEKSLQEIDKEIANYADMVPEPTGQLMELAEKRDTILIGLGEICQTKRRIIKLK